MKYKFNVKLLLGAVAIAIFTAACQSPSLNGANSPNNSTEDASSSAPAQTDTTPVSERTSGLNLTDAQKTQMKQIREQSQTKILALLSPEQQEEYKSATQGRDKTSWRALRSLNLSTEQKQQVRQILRDQRQQTQAILTPEQRAQIKQRRSSKQQDSSN
ncbi:Spy/CpxP family protein refolding chaperone [Nostoc sp. UHCC 0302]|uniref:Spy/CpxP family protein refolding chaperone n=1 Tax=Nostoc sp. UHCC 0302 TaxID=3134896 RepID=UPI00311CAF2D